MTAVATMVRSEPPPARAIELVLAHAHLRLGALALARVELETMATLGILDGSGLVDLAEVRWRTGDLVGAGEAAGAAMQAGVDDPIALTIAAEVGVLARSSERSAPTGAAGDGDGRRVDRCDLRGDAPCRGLAPGRRRAATDRADPVRSRAGDRGAGRGSRVRGGVPGVVRGARHRPFRRGR